MSAPGVEDCYAKLGCLCSLLSDVIRAHEHTDDEPVDGASLYGLQHLAEQVNAELAAAITARQW